MAPKVAQRWWWRYKTAPTVLSKALTSIEPLMPPAMLALLLWAVSYLVAAGIGFHPITLNGYKALPNIGCVGDPVRVRLERTRARVPLGTVTEVEVWSYWLSENGDVTPKEPFSTEIGPLGRHVIENELVRTMPILPGQWKMVWEVAVTGQVLGFETEQTFTKNTEQLLRVVAETPTTRHLCWSP